MSTSYQPSLTATPPARLAHVHSGPLATPETVFTRAEGGIDALTGRSSSDSPSTSGHVHQPAHDEVIRLVGQHRPVQVAGELAEPLRGENGASRGGRCSSRRCGARCSSRSRTRSQPGRAEPPPRRRLFSSPARRSSSRAEPCTLARLEVLGREVELQRMRFPFAREGSASRPERLARGPGRTGGTARHRVPCRSALVFRRAAGAAGDAEAGTAIAVKDHLGEEGDAARGSRERKRIQVPVPLL